MDNPERGEVGFTFGGKTLTFKFSNAGKRAVESALEMEKSDIVRKISTYSVGDRMISALFFGATRKYHARDFTSLSAVDDYLDLVADSEDADELDLDLTACLIAAYLRTTKKSILVDYFRQEDPDAEEPDEGSSGSSEGEPAPKAEGSPSTSKKSGSRSGAGKSSSAKQPEAA